MSLEVGRDALAAHRTFAPEVVHPVEVKATEEAHLAQWLSKRLRRRLVIPDLEADGLHLVGGRLLPAGPDVAAQLMYAGQGGVRLTLYVRCGETGSASVQTMREGDLSSVYWVSAGTGYAISGPVDRGRLMEVARTVSRDLDTVAPL